MTPDDNKKLVEIVARATYYAEDMGERPEWGREPSTVQARYRLTARAVLNVIESSDWKIVPVEPTEAQLNAARDWAVAKYGIGVGNDGATGCYRAMLSASPKVTP